HSIDPDCKIMVAIRNPPQHAKVRRVWARGFTPEALRAYHPILDKRTEQLLNHLGERTGQAIDLSKWLTWFTHDKVNDMAFGDDLDTMQNKDSQAFLETIEDAISFGIIIFHLPWAAPFMRAIPVIAKKSKAFHNACYTRIKKRLEAGSESGTQDLIYHLMGNGRQGSTTLDINQLVSDSPLIVGAGSDTTSLTLSTLFYFLLDNPVAYSRLQAEIDDSKLAWNDPLGLTHLEYLNAVINEALRILPAIPSGSSRAPLIGSGGIALGSHFLPEGTTASIHTYTLHRDPRNFFLPDKFLPERWLSEEKQLSLEPDLFKNRELVIHNPDAFIPFSYGPADCVGKRFAWLELRAVTVAILQRFTLRFDLGYDKVSWERDMCDYLVTKRPPLYVVLTPRLDSL
ncbi:Cytochrome P450 67, partial [Termitomyces sp. T112]